MSSKNQINSNGAKTDYIFETTPKASKTATTKKPRTRESDKSDVEKKISEASLLLDKDAINNVNELINDLNNDDSLDMSTTESVRTSDEGDNTKKDASVEDVLVECDATPNLGLLRNGLGSTG